MKLRPRGLCGDLNIIPGVVENGLFIDVCSAVIVGYSDGTAEISWKKTLRNKLQRKSDCLMI